MDGLIRRCLKRGHGLFGHGGDPVCHHGEPGEPDICVENTLSTAVSGKIYTIVGLSCGCSLNERISAMGLNSGAHFTIVSNSGHGPVGLEVKGTRLGIGRGMAQKIRVKEVGSDNE